MLPLGQSHQNNHHCNFAKAGSILTTEDTENTEKSNEINALVLFQTCF